MENKVSFEYDPKGTYEDLQWCKEACGLIPYWITDWQWSESEEPLKTFLGEAYGFGLYEMSGHVDALGDYVSPYEEDEDLEPYMRANTPEGTLWQYPYGIVAIPLGPDGGHYITRMD